jgi:hypothetical protein
MREAFFNICTINYLMISLLVVEKFSEETV